jgi:hypothetical protein
MQTRLALSWIGTTGAGPAWMYDALVDGQSDHGADQQIVHELPRCALEVFAGTRRHARGQSHKQHPGDRPRGAQVIPTWQTDGILIDFARPVAVLLVGVVDLAGISWSAVTATFAVVSSVRRWPLNTAGGAFGIRSGRTGVPRERVRAASWSRR